MDHIHYFQCFAAGLTGVMVYTLVKIRALKVRSRVGNVPFTIKEYFSDDWPSVTLSVLAVLIVMFTFDEIISADPCIADNIKWFFIAVGYSGSSLLQTWLGKSDKKINDIVDIKTNIADSIN